MDWQTFVSRASDRCDKRNRAFRTFLHRTQKLAAIAHPETGGNECLVHNWGNEESRRIWRDGWTRWHSYSNESDRRYQADWRTARDVA